MAASDDRSVGLFRDPEADADVWQTFHSFGDCMAKPFALPRWFRLSRTLNVQILDQLFLRVSTC